ncbi:histidine phosphatase family protein [Streptacidiphilus sp. ASG 303]|uniref:histidine phosphatase family protein n=1 Tax=Streptacidiphilus sp. ASG 303 TaxID=2896847 RepID=UPI001E4E1ADC|nr:histidine phosphatase family protein [Streptacidiphilus sp. ASG 303]MCD0483326.1 histidine phosphatase family protein [Streptacidiphilus sp. ASG 303]
MPARILIVRHGETEWSATGRHTGRTDIPLTEEGRHMARALGERLKRAPWDGLPGARVLTSPLARARETCELAGLGDRAVPAPELMEWDYGAYEGRTGDAIRADGHPGWVIWRDGVPGGETLADVSARVDAFLARIDEEHGRPHQATVTMDCADCTVVLFAHGHLLRILTARWLGLPPEYGQRFKLRPASLGVLGWEYAEPAVELWNDTAHLA